MSLEKEDHMKEPEKTNVVRAKDQHKRMKLEHRRRLLINKREMGVSLSPEEQAKLTLLNEMLA